MIELSEPYAPRKTTFLGLDEIESWRLKVYGIAYEHERPRDALIAAAKNLAARRLAALREAGEEVGYRVGFLGIHGGRGANFVFLDWWADENELHHLVFVSPPESPQFLEERTGSGLLACVWDLKVICFERQAWLTHVLQNPDGPNLEGYLGCSFSEYA
jgi:prepilin-type processing-associated H-X9-DG protein